MAPKLTQKSIMQSIRGNNDIAAGEGMTVARMGQKVSIQAAPSGPIAIPGSSIVAFSFVEEFDNWITAKRYNWASGEESETLTYIAKPPHLRRDFYENFNTADPPVQEPIVYPDGNEFLYIYSSENVRLCGPSGESYNEYQQITPSYYVGEVIYCMTAQTGLQNGDGATIVWVDITPRLWARIN